MLARDCDDSEAGIHPGATELCNGVDDDCDRRTDEDGACADRENPCATVVCDHIEGCFDGYCLRDRDGDGTPQDDDCDDNDPRSHPGAEEVCDGLDNDCDLRQDEGCDFTDSCVEAHPPEIDFGLLDQNEESEYLTLELRACSDAIALVYGCTRSTSSAFRVGGCAHVPRPAQDVSLTIGFHDDRPGLHSAELRFDTSDPTNRTLIVPIRAERAE